MIDDNADYVHQEALDERSEWQQELYDAVRTEGERATMTYEDGSEREPMQGWYVESREWFVHMGQNCAGDNEYVRYFMNTEEREDARMEVWGMNIIGTVKLDTDS